MKTWKNAAAWGSIDEIVRCYSETFQPVMHQNLEAMTEEQITAMAKETRETRFRIQRIVFRGTMAHAKVIRRRGNGQEDDVVNFVKESGAWKLIP